MIYRYIFQITKNPHDRTAIKTRRKAFEVHCDDDAEAVMGAHCYSARQYRQAAPTNLVVKFGVYQGEREVNPRLTDVEKRLLRVKLMEITNPKRVSEILRGFRLEA